MVYNTKLPKRSVPGCGFIFNAFDLIICVAGHNAFREAIFVPVSRCFEDQRKRVEECLNYRFTENGTNQLVNFIVSHFK